MAATNFPPPPPATSPGDLAGRQWQSWFYQLHALSSNVVIGLNMPANTFTVTGSPVYNNGTFNVTYNSQAQGLALMSPAIGTGTPSFRAIVDSDIGSPNTLNWLNSHC